MREGKSTGEKLFLGKEKKGKNQENLERGGRTFLFRGESFHV